MICSLPGDQPHTDPGVTHPVGDAQQPRPDGDGGPFGHGGAGDNRIASRANFGDAVDFVGWYNHHSVQRSNIALTDARNLYLAYHEGHTGYNRGTYQNKRWLLDAAAAVERNAVRYQTQYATCRDSLDRGWF